MTEFTKIEGGVCAPSGFMANGVHCGLYADENKLDLALIYSDSVAVGAGVYTKNLVKGAPLQVTQKHLSDGYASAIVCNSGNANTCNENGFADAEKMAIAIAQEMQVSSIDVLVASTGVIGVPLDVSKVKDASHDLVEGLAYGAEAASKAAHAIMTTDTVDKQVAFSFDLGGKTCRIGGMAKGSGMIHPNMATMLVFITTDVMISSEMLQEALSADVEDSFNMVSVDGDTSTNDMVLILANGQGCNAMIEEKDENYAAFCEALAMVTKTLCKMIAADGEGATKLITCNVIGGKDKQMARTVAKSVIDSSLVKAAIFGADANWGRVLCAIGYSGAEVEVNRIDCSFKSAAGEFEVCKLGYGKPFEEDFASKVLSESEIEININLNMGDEFATAWGCDLTYEYVKINGDYRS